MSPVYKPVVYTLNLAQRAGFEPAGPYGPPIFRTGAISRSAIAANWWDTRDSNSDPAGYEPAARPIELMSQIGGSKRCRTSTLRIFSPPLRPRKLSTYMAAPTGADPAISCVTGRRLCCLPSELYWGVVERVRSDRAPYLLYLSAILHAATDSGLMTAL